MIRFFFQVQGYLGHRKPLWGMRWLRIKSPEIINKSIGFFPNNSGESGCKVLEGKRMDEIVSSFLQKFIGLNMLLQDHYKIWRNRRKFNIQRLMFYTEMFFLQSLSFQFKNKLKTWNSNKLVQRWPNGRACFQTIFIYPCFGKKRSSEFKNIQCLTLCQILMM